MKQKNDKHENSKPAKRKNHPFPLFFFIRQTQFYAKIAYKYSTISHLIDILGQLAPTMLFLLRYRGCFSVSNFLNIGNIAVSPSNNSDSELAPYSSAFERCLRDRWWCSGATFGDEWWCECCIDLANFRCGVVDWTVSRSRSLSVSLWPNGCFGLWRCFGRFFSETLRWIGAAVVLLFCCSYVLWTKCACSWHLCGFAWFRGDWRCFAWDNVWVSHKSLCDTTKFVPFVLAAPIWTLTRRCCSVWFKSETLFQEDNSPEFHHPFSICFTRNLFNSLFVLPLCGQMLFNSLFECVNDEFTCVLTFFSSISC